MSARAQTLGLSSATVVLALVGASACGSSSTEAAPTDAGSDDAAEVTTDANPDAKTDAPVGCARTLAAADRARKVVISHPYDAAAKKAKVFEVLDLSTSGALTRPATPVTFSMGTAL